MELILALATLWATSFGISNLDGKVQVKNSKPTTLRSLSNGNIGTPVHAPAISVTIIEKKP